MSREKTSEEVKQQHIEAMGADLGSLYHALWNELAWLHLKWGEYVELFGTKPSRIQLMNQAAGQFFRIVQDSLWEGSLLHVARLTDPVKTSGKENLTIRKLLHLVGDEELKERISGFVNVAVDKASFCRDWRNKHIAHKDLGLSLGLGAEHLMPASRAQVKEVLNSISDVLNEVSGYYMNSTTAFDGITAVNGAAALLYVVDDGLRADEERQERLKAGNDHPKDYQVRDL